jgi:Na+-driven multidrug efflux pump
MSTESKRGMILAGIVFAYFVEFPADLAAILAPVREVLSLTTTVSPWVYAVVASGVIAWALVRCFGRSQDVTAR